MTALDSEPETVLVAPREIVDYAARACRVAGLDAGDADAVARDLAVRQLLDTGTLATFVDALADGALDGHTRRALAESLDERDDELLDDLRRSAARHGAVVDLASWDRLRATAAEFLVSEQVLDAADD